MNFKKEEILVIVLAIVLFLGFILFVKPSTIGYVIHMPLSYNYNSSLVNFSGNQIKLIPIVTTATSTLESRKELNTATQNGNNVLSKVNSLENDDIMIHENDQNKILNINFSDNLDDNDIISIYFKHNKETLVKICPENNLCLDAYASATYNGNPKWINFTLDLTSARNSFGIFPTQDKVKIDYIYGTHITSTTNTKITYPSSATIETNDIEPANISRFDYFNYSHTLNDQNIGYYYSADSGNNWVNLTDQNISSLNLTKIRIRAKLYSNNTETPIINSLSLFYIENAITSQNENNSSSNTNTFIREVLADNGLIYMKIYSDSNLSHEIITITSSNLTNPNKNKLKAIEINANININSAILRVNYTNDELGNLNESSLGLYYYNTSGNWEEKTITINVDEKYIETNLTHLSIYGIFGENNTQNNQGGSSGESSGGSGSRASASNSGSGRAPSSRASDTETKVAQTIPKKQEIKEIKLFESQNEKKENKNQNQEIITTQAIKEVNSKTSLGLYAFVILVFLSYIIYHFKVKKTNFTKSKNKIKKLKNQRFKVKRK